MLSLMEMLNRTTCDSPIYEQQTRHVNKSDNQYVVGGSLIKEISASKIIFDQGNFSFVI